MASDPDEPMPFFAMLLSRRSTLALIAFLVGIFAFAALGVGLILTIIASGNSSTPQNQNPRAAIAPTRHFTDVPVISAIPPTPTLTLTPTETPTHTATATPTRTPTLTPSPTATATPTATPTRRPPTRVPTTPAAQGQACT